ncbi:ATP-binding protein [Nocardioides sp. CER19]|uniref:ATP-binding protein n=1 Tax=Nocardioides sp. CER19 TaxID=3038538 RepID=UPI0024469BD1|nr:ATP-binding protein [Nocardioides sp. CER19]MDH2413819.1 ATP-binding protein [Nocardioides sp. CER19]
MTDNTKAAKTLNLLDRIDAKLANPDVTLDRQLFERASVSMLSDIYPSLVPITGGSDDGRDAEIDDPGGTIGVLVTSARELDGVLENLRGGCRQMVKKDVSLRRLILANLAVLNASKRRKVTEAAEAEGFSVVQIYPRAWYADSLRRNADWRLQLLQLEGGPFSLSRPPLEALSVDIDSTVGREEELEAMRTASGDLVVSGAPGVGKTHLVAQVDGAVFVVRASDLSRLADDLLEVDPAVVVIDDAGGRLGALTDLQTIRSAHGLRFRAIAVCWPHEAKAVCDRFESADAVEVGRMTNSELGQILRGQGITSDAVLHRILDQARGRPAWAVRLGSLLKDVEWWNKVMRGDTVRAEVDRYLRNARISEHPYEVLAMIALIGGLRDIELKTLADLLGATVLDIHSTVRKIAQSGLLDAEPEMVRGERTAVLYSVQPDLLAASVCADAFFSGAPAPLTPGQLQAAFPDRALAILLNSVIAELVGASHPIRPSTAQIVETVGTSWGRAEDSLLSHFALLGAAEARFVMNLVTEALGTALGARTALNEPDTYLYYDNPTANVRGELLAEIAARSPRRIGYLEALSFVQRGAVTLLDARVTIDTFLNSFLENVRQVDLGEPVRVSELVMLSEAVGQLPSVSENAMRAFFELATGVLMPVWEANYTAPDQPRSFNLRSYLLPADSLEKVASPVLDRLEREVAAVTPDAFIKLLKTLESWVHLARGFARHGGLVVTSEHRAAARVVAGRFAHLLAATTLTPGMRQRLNEVAAPLGLKWDEQDNLFAALAGHDPDAYEPAEDPDDDDDQGSKYLARYEAKVSAERARIESAVTPYLTQAPVVLCERLEDLRSDLVLAKKLDKVSTAFEVIARKTDAVDLVPWLEAAIDHGLEGHARPVVRALVSADAIPETLVERLLATADGRFAALRTSIEYGTGRNLEQMMTSVTVDDFRHRMHDSFLFASPAALRVLNQHADRQVAALAMTSWAHWYEYASRTDRSDIERVTAQLEAIPDWTTTMLELDIPSPLDDHALERGLVVLARTSPADFETLFLRHIRKEGYPHNDFDEWAPAAATLDHTHKTQIWDRVREHPCRQEVFWALAGGDSEWVGDRIAANEVGEPAGLLGHQMFGAPAKLSPEDMARLFGPYADPELILESLPGPPSDGGVETAEHRLQQATELAASELPEVAQVGRAGVEIYTVRLAAACKYAREQELRGNPWD